MLLIPQGSPLLKFQYFKFEAGILDPGLNTVFEKNQSQSLVITESPRLMQIHFVQILVKKPMQSENFHKLLCITIGYLNYYDFL